MVEILRIFIEAPTTLIGMTSMAMALDQRFKTKKYREKLSKELEKLRQDNQYIIKLLEEGVYITINSVNDNSLTIIQTQENKVIGKVNKNPPINVVNEIQIIENEYDTPIKFLLKYSTRQNLFLDEKSIILEIPPLTKEYFQLSVIKTTIGINKQLYFQLENKSSGLSEYFETEELKETEYQKPIHIICSKNQSELLVEVKMDGIIVGTGKYAF
jgi:hypothetical protein